MIRLENVDFSYDGSSLFRGFNLEFPKAELVFVLGPNGSGKSSLLRLMAGLIDPAKGSVLYADKPMEKIPLRERARQIAWLSQAPSPPFPCTVRDFLRTGRYAHRDSFAFHAPSDDGQIAESLTLLCLEQVIDRNIHQLSGGEVQLVRIARALVQNTNVLLLDEPFGPLDIRHRNDLWKALRKPGRLTVVVTHEFSTIGPDCDRVILLNNGNIVADGKPENVLSRENLLAAYDWSSPEGWQFQPFPFR